MLTAFAESFQVPSMSTQSSWVVIGRVLPSTSVSTVAVAFGWPSRVPTWSTAVTVIDSAPIPAMFSLAITRTRSPTVSSFDVSTYRSTEC